jgi:hypothetical protein
MTCGTNFTLEKTVSVVPPVVIVAAATVVPDLRPQERSASAPAIGEIREHGPPLYLRNASFLI